MLGSTTSGGGRPNTVGSVRPESRSVPILAAATLKVLIACSDAAGPVGSAAASTTVSVSAEANDNLPQGAESVDLDPTDFTTEIDNPYFPVTPGTRLTYRESGPEGELELW